MSGSSEIEANDRRSLLERLTHSLAACPLAFDLLRWLLEFGYRGEKRVLREENLPAAGRLLDLGCGTGTMAGMFSAKTYIGLDFSIPYVRRARRKHSRKRFLAGDGQSLPFPPNSFDAVLVAGVLHHLATGLAERVLSEIGRVLVQPDGKLVLWEDVPAIRPLNLPGRLVNRLDEGDSIRPPQLYRELVEKHLHIEKQYSMASGVCEYTVIVACTK